MKNTKKSGKLHFVIFKWSRRYIGICRETGFVEESEDFNVVKSKLVNGTLAVLKAIITSPENLEASLNSSPPLKYKLYFYLAPILGFIELLRDTSKSENYGSYSFIESIPQLKTQMNG